MDNDPTTGSVPLALVKGVPMLKITSKKIKQVVVRLRGDTITWTSRIGGRVDVKEIRELRIGQPPTDLHQGARWLTIVYVRNAQWKVLHMIALTDEVYNLWVETLRKVVSESSDRLISQISPSDPDTVWIRQLWPAGAQHIEPSTAISLCSQIGLSVPSGLEPKTRLDLPTFRQLVIDSQQRPDLVEIWTALGPPNCQNVDRFLADVQKLDPSNLFERYADRGEWTLHSLTTFLSSSDNSPSLSVDMTRPLAEYYISSSHNTYLVGEQWRGESTVEGYIRVLLAGCRCVEMDCHNGETEPIVYHGKTLTSSVAVRDVCQAINTYAFVSNPYPVIISAETRCSVDQQEKLAIILREVFGSRLVTEPLAFGVPSPENLKGRILFKTKPPSPDEPPSPGQPDVTDSSESDSSLARLARRLSLSSPKPFSPKLIELLVYTAGVKYRGFSKLLNYQPHQQFSVSDRTANRILKENKNDWVKHNFTHLSRVYPKASRMTSSNFDPLPFWAAGCQIVALNWQTIDTGTKLNHAMFQDGGYVLKPLALRLKISEPIRQYRLRINIISAQRTPPSPDLVVEVTLGALVRKTAHVSGMSCNPMWNETFDFMFESTASMLSLVFIRVETRGRNMLAQWSRSVATTLQGYHYLPLFDTLFSRFLFATLFVRIDFGPID